MSQQFIITVNIDFAGDRNLLIGERVEAYVHLRCSEAVRVRDRPSPKQRGATLNYCSRLP